VSIPLIKPVRHKPGCRVAQSQAVVLDRFRVNVEYSTALIDPVQAGKRHSKGGWEAGLVSTEANSFGLTMWGLKIW